jgi:dephospho-CoA kinase
MILVGLTGGIGAGKSTVSAGLAARGAVIVDADAIVHQVQRPGMPVVSAMAERFGAEVLGPDGALDRAAVARIVFNDPQALKDLNRIVHPAVNREIARQALGHRESDDVVVLDIPLLLDSDRRRNVSAIVVVDCPVDVAVDRLVRYRGMTEDDARARVARQVDRDTRLAAATLVIDNAGDEASLARRIDEAWAWMQALPAATAEDLAPLDALVADAPA